MRHEVRATEHRAPIVPADTRRLVEHGIELTVEDSPQRLFALSDYADAGCTTMPAGSWVQASHEHYVLGLKELPALPAALTQRHVFFGHAYRGQRGAHKLLQRFASGGGALLDLEYLTDARGRRLAAFGYWAGYVGAALAILHLRRRLHGPLRALSQASLDDTLTRSHGSEEPRVLVIGARGRGGRGARAALATAGISPTCWGLAETRSLDRRTLLEHDVLVNAVSTPHPVTPFLTAADLADPARRLTVVADVTCDVRSDYNVLPINDSTTDWQQPVRRLRHDEPVLDIIAIDNLPSLLPREASVDFSAQLLPHLLQLGSAAPAWLRCLRAFHEACAEAGVEAERAMTEPLAPADDG
jgi:saccharopine dehydrogenase (NAD+, L-lysine-forming)